MAWHGLDGKSDKKVIYRTLPSPPFGFVFFFFFPVFFFSLVFSVASKHTDFRLLFNIFRGAVPVGIISYIYIFMTACSNTPPTESILRQASALRHA